MTQREIALAAADEVFKDSLKNVFQVLASNLSSAHGEAEISAAVEKAQRGIQVCQLTATKAIELAQTLPQS